MITQKLHKATKKNVTGLKNKLKETDLLNTRDFNERMIDSLDKKKKDLIPIVGPYDKSIEKLDAAIDKYRHENYNINIKLGIFS